MVRSGTCQQRGGSWGFVHLCNLVLQRRRGKPGQAGFKDPSDATVALRSHNIGCEPLSRNWKPLGSARQKLGKQVLWKNVLLADPFPSPYLPHRWLHNTLCSWAEAFRVQASYPSENWFLKVEKKTTRKFVQICSQIWP